MSLSPDQIADLRTDLLAYSMHMFKARKGFDFVENWHHAEICNALERVIIGETKRLIINIPPRYSKTELAVINFISFCMGNWPDSEFIHASYSKRLATLNTYMSRAQVTNEAHVEIFGKCGINTDSRAKDEWRTASGGCVYAAGTDGTITGYGAGKLREGFGGCCIIDDPHKANQATSDTYRENVIDWFQNTIESRLNSPDTPIIVIMQRLHEQDLAGWLLDGNNGEKWEHLCIPVINPDGTALWSFKHTLEKLRQMEAAAPYVFTGQYMQSPTPLGGGMFKPANWPRYDTFEDLYNPRTAQGDAITATAIHVDTAQKTKEHNDYSVFEVWGLGKDDIYLLDVVRGKWEAPELRKIAKAVWDKWKGRHKKMAPCRGFFIEDKSSGTGLIQDLQRYTSAPVTPVPRSIDKVSRAHDATPHCAVGRVWLPEDAPWLGAFVAEVAAFSANMAHMHDDQVDPLMDAVDRWLIRGRSVHDLFA